MREYLAQFKYKFENCFRSSSKTRKVFNGSWCLIEAHRELICYARNVILGSRDVIIVKRNLLRCYFNFSTDLLTVQFAMLMFSLNIKPRQSKGSRDLGSFSPVFMSFSINSLTSLAKSGLAAICSKTYSADLFPLFFKCCFVALIMTSEP